MSTRTQAHTASIRSQMIRAMFSSSVASYAFGSALATRWMEGGSESSFPGSQTKRGCTRLEAEVSQLRQRLNSEMALLPIVKSTDAGGLTCQFVFPVARGSQDNSTSTAPPPVAVSHDVEEVDVAEMDQYARTEDPQGCVSPEDIKEACGHISGVEDFCITEDVFEGDDNDWFWYGGMGGEDVAGDRPDEIEGYTLRGCNDVENPAKAERAGVG